MKLWKSMVEVSRGKHEILHNYSFLREATPLSYISSLPAPLPKLEMASASIKMFADYAIIGNGE